MNHRSNKLIAQISNHEYELIHYSCRLVSLKQGDQLFFPGGPTENVFFPINALISIAKESKDGESVDMAIVGEEGAVGLRGLFFNNNPYRVTASTSGLAYAVSMKAIEALSQSGPWVHLIYIQSNHQILEQIAVEASCIHFHSVYQRVARWLLIRGHRTNSILVNATHQDIATSLGVRREAVTLALNKLPRIYYFRGNVKIQDFSLLEKEACNCPRPNAEPSSFPKIGTFSSHARELHRS